MWSQHSSKTFVNVAHQSKWEQQISISGNISTSSAKLPIKSGNLQIPPVGTVQPLPRSCWDLGAVVEAQLLQSRRFAQNLEKICGAIDAFAVVIIKAPVQGETGRIEQLRYQFKVTLWQLTPI